LHDPQLRFLLRVAYGAVLAALVWFCARYLLVWLLPFVIALGLSALAEPVIDFCRQKLQLRRSFTAAVLTLALLGILTALVSVLLVQLLRQAYAFLSGLPQQLEHLPQLLDTLQARFDRFCAACPEVLRKRLEHFLDNLSTPLTDLFQQVSSWCLSLVTAALGKVPQLFLFTLTTVLALFFTAGSYPSILAFFRRQLPPQRLETARGVKANLFSTLGKWLRSELTLIAITFAQLLLGLLLLRQPYALLLAVLIALIDALPVFGTGTVLIPWALLCFVVDDIPRGIALIALYAVILLVRSIMEPRIMAAQADLPPLVTLLAIWLGFCTMGVAGMLLFPIALLFVKQLHDAGFVRLGK
jgi:sporulation integral membrane protein YtvI